ncbi:hypothetical protein EV694_1700 [Volucribacter psittacicida]|uniref:Uncharacterized protein n=1 Tax=Volucribacter psittacicida TaxID=203482 RepID=A0A4R1FUE6_9PAST|nr:hypothetical protein [Volucribacter psittacicida]TCJ96148.1 hypothetical protein EV694_1700 [Volucribacter psittacicida]
MSKAAKFTAKLKHYINAVKSGEQKSVRVGVIENQHYENGNPVAYIAAIQEYGSEHIPPRPFFRPTIATKKTTWAGKATALLKRGNDVESVLEILGEIAAADIVETISNIHSPPLSLATKIARNRKAHQKNAKGRRKRPKSVSIKPLIDSGLLVTSISSQVVEGE